MKKSRKSNFVVDFAGKTIGASASTLAKASKPEKPEYADLCELISNHPDFKIVEIKQQSHTDKKVPRPSFNEMKEYIETQADSDARLREFEAVKKIAHAKNATYAYTRKWFLETFKDYANEVSADEIKSALTAEAVDDQKEAVIDISDKVAETVDNVVNY